MGRSIKKMSKRIYFCASSELLELIKDEANKRNISNSSLIRLAVTKYIDDEKKERG